MNAPFRSPAPGPRVFAAGRIRLRRDLWGRLVFAPPELVNPRAIFDPVPFRSVPPFAGWTPRPALRR
jgi:hypothetical protein